MHILNKEAFLQGAGTVTQQKNYTPTTCSLIIMRKPKCKCSILVHYDDTHGQAAGEWHLFFFKDIQLTSSVPQRK